jgi:hypothetical protein
MADGSEDDRSIDAEQEYAKRKAAEHQEYQRRLQLAKTRRAQEEHWKQDWSRLESALEKWSSKCNHETVGMVADAVVNLAHTIRDLGFEEYARLAVNRLDQLHEIDPTGKAINLCFLSEVRIICRWLVHVSDGSTAADISDRIRQLPASGDFARNIDSASFEVHARSPTYQD